MMNFLGEMEGQSWAKSVTNFREINVKIFKLMKRQFFFKFGHLDSLENIHKSNQIEHKISNKFGCIFNLLISSPHEIAHIQII